MCVSSSGERVRRALWCAGVLAVRGVHADEGDIVISCCPGSASAQDDTSKSVTDRYTGEKVRDDEYNDVDGT